MAKNKKGFTLVELLAIIIIIGIILIIAFPLINNVIGTVRKRTCFLNTKSMEKAALNYVVFENKKLPESSSINIPLQELRNRRYLTPVLDPTDLKTECDGYVKITEDNGDYKTEGHLVCPTYCNAEEFEDDTKEKNDAYYFDGADPNNWVLFGRFDQSSVYGLLWRIVKTDDGGRKLVFEGLENGGNNPLEDGRASLGGTTGIPYDVLGNNKYKKSSLNEALQTWLNNIYVINKDRYIKKTNWRIGGIPFNNPTSLDTFIELEGKDTETEFGQFDGLSDLSGVGLLNPSDYMLTSSNPGCVSSYQLGGSFNPCIYTETELNNFLYKDKYHYWTMNASSDTGNKAWYINNIGHITTTLANSSIISVRPVINLEKTLPFLAGSGTIDDPYILEDYMLNIKNAPIITLIGDGSVVVREGDMYYEEGATAYDPEDGDITDKIQITSNVNVNIPGEYQVEYNVIDSDGNKAPTVVRHVIVSKKENPVIKLLGGNPLKLTLKHEYVEPGATAIDPYYGDISDDIKITGQVNTNELGVYEITYNVTNKDGKKAVTVVRKVIVEPPRPVITLNGDNPTNVYVGGIYTELGATAIDEIDGDLTSQLKKTIRKIEIGKSPKVEVNEVVVDKKYRYEITYSVTNSFGVTTSEIRRVYILPDDGPKIEFVPNGSNISKQKHEVQINVTKTKYDIDNDSLKYMWVSQYWRLPYKSTLEDVIRTKFTNNSTVSKLGTTGLYRLYAIAKDIYGNTTIKATSYYRVDNSKPQLWLNGSNPQRILIGTPYVEQGARAYDKYYSGNITNRIKITGDIDINNPGNYSVFYSVSDDAGNTTTRTRKVIVYLSQPKITLKGSKTEKVILGQDYVEPGYVATDEKDGNITNKVVVSGTVNRDKVGTYPITYTVTNSLGETTTVTRDVMVYIPEPVITITGSNPLNHKVLEAYTDLGATAYDLIDGDLTSRIQVSSNINTKIKGKYEVTYKVTNNNGKTTTSKRVVNVYAPKPVLKLNGDSFIKMFINDIYEEKGATAIDEIDGDITNDIKIIGSVNPSKVGTYQLKYEVTNSFGEISYKIRTVQVVEPQISISLKGDNPYQMKIFDEYIEPGYVAIHEQLGDITNKIEVSSNLNAKVAGKYKVTYLYKTDYGVTKSVTRNITVHQQDGPKISFEPNGSLEYKQNYAVKVNIEENFGELDATSFKYLWTTTQSKPSETSFGVPFTNGEIINTPSGKSGKYYLWVIAKDIYNNTTIKSSNTYLLDNIAPVIKLNGPSIIEIPVDSIYKELGATVIEEHSGLNKDGLVITSNIVPGILGTYTVTYNAIDNSGLKAKPVTRTVNVVEASLKDAPGEDFVPKYRAEYFIGADPKNWVEFGNASDNIYDYIPILWRIVKADEEGIKIIYEGPYNKGNKPLVDGKLIDSMFDGTSDNYNNSLVKTHLEKWYNDLNEPNKETLTKAINWCIGSVNQPYDVDTFKAEECLIKTTNKSSIGLLNSVDYLLTSSEPCNAYNQSACGISNFLKKGYDYMTINGVKDQPGYIFGAESNGALRRSSITKNQGLRPVINLRPDVLILGGDGTLQNPYKLNTRIPILDETPPTVTFEYNNPEQYQREHEVKVIVTDDISGVDTSSLKYVWTDSTTKPIESNFTSPFVNGETIKSPSNMSGTYYLWVIAKDRKGNQTITMSNSIVLDNEPPVITINGEEKIEVLIDTSYTDLGATAIDNIDGDITTDIVATTNVNINKVGSYNVTYTVTDSSGNKSTKIRIVNVVNNVDFIYTGDYQTFTAPKTGWYKIEAWGASGGFGRTHWELINKGGNGAYTSGITPLKKGEKLYIYVGGKGDDASTSGRYSGGDGGYNGGGKGGDDSNRDSLPEPGGGGGGATDIRLVSGVWNDFNSIKSRIMVAAGGGGGNYDGVGGAGGGVQGTIGIGIKDVADQKTGFKFGIGMDGGNSCYAGPGGGGSGYYGGYSAIKCLNNGSSYTSGGGGSSFVSGCLGCNAINSSSTSTNIIHSEIPIHYSNKYFDDIRMISGDDQMKNPNGDITKGNLGDGYARISLVGSYDENLKITIKGQKLITLFVGQTYMDEGATALDAQGRDLTSKMKTTSNINPNIPGTYTITYKVTDSSGNVSTSLRMVKFLPVVYNYEHIGDYQKFTAPLNGNYQIELWGASGGRGRQNNKLVYNGGAGSYVRGIIKLEKEFEIYIYVGEQGGDSPSAKVGGSGGYNGGGYGGRDSRDDDSSGGGGGATDIRLVGSSWDNLNSLKSRIMVASGGGGSSFNSVGGAAGKLTSQNICSSVGAAQTIGYKFGIGQNGTDNLTVPSAGGGGGYYGGTSKHLGSNDFCESASGGSSFISGYPGADAINFEGIHTGQPNHYSGLIFTNSVMIDGNSSMPSPDGGTQIGQSGHGYARITLLLNN